ncbi:beta-phosphoglucomutase [Claveliimonas bilis]|uniref:beta-phosphoglucomutase n=1 Tax=Claveliimonas bilis TaxID=3028070 RepID=UPI00292F68CD|nr:beta-phosphoglucomutase [Claveliimonas bilis]BDZ80169.1 beta-phosphoglucomutase [Claveliimonas bilis]
MKAVIFDLDGVVVNTAKYHYLAWKKLAEELGFYFDIKHNERLKGVSRMESLRIVLETGGIQGISQKEKEELAARKNGYYLEMISRIDESEILPGIPEFLNRLKQEGIKIALGSASKSGRMILEKLNLAGQFDAIVDGNLVEKPKPDPEVFVTAARLLQIPCEQCTVVEDAAAGIEAAHAGGMKCIGIGDRAILGRADAVVESTEKLAKIDLQAL